MENLPEEIAFNYFNEKDIVELTTTQKRRNKYRRYFPSNRPQTFIKNAQTGVPYPYIVGSVEQALLYKIVDTTGTCDKEGYIIDSPADLPNPNPNHLFYDSPEQCMNHLHLTVNSLKKIT